jgi:threonine dehydrogenase-like Zn-dependent dehydrogenase
VQDLIVRGKIDPKVLVTHRGGLADFPALFKKVCEEPESVMKAVILNP